MTQYTCDSTDIALGCSRQLKRVIDCIIAMLLRLVNGLLRYTGCI